MKLTGYVVGAAVFSERDPRSWSDTLEFETSGVASHASLAALPPLGVVIEGKFRLVRHLGCGGMGMVYLAHDETLDRPVAIKMLQPARASEPTQRAFVREGRAMARVHHPNVVAIHSLGEHHGLPYLVMEYVPGVDLAHWLRSRDDWSLARSMEVLEPLCRGLQAIHDGGTLHRDIKPGNVMLGPCGRVAIADFGLARPVDYEHDDAELFMGTPGYVAPEVAVGGPIERGLAARIDVYGLGVLAYEVLTGERPFTARATAGLLAQHAYDAPPAPSTHRAELKPFDRPLLRALSKRPRDRTPTPDALRQDLLVAHASASHRPYDLLVVDDDVAALEALGSLLELTFPGSRLRTARDAATAMQMALEHPPDVVITDLDMPAGGGLGLTRSLRTHASTQGVSIIVVTGRGGSHEWTQLHRAGANRFLVKPVDFDALATMIRSTTPA